MANNQKAVKRLTSGRSRTAFTRTFLVDENRRLRSPGRRKAVGGDFQVRQRRRRRRRCRCRRQAFDRRGIKAFVFQNATERDIKDLENPETRPTRTRVTQVDPSHLDFYSTVFETDNETSELLCCTCRQDLTKSDGFF